MFELIAGTAAGGVTGLIGSLAGKVFGFFERKQKLQEKKMEFEQELKLLELEHTFQSQEREHEHKLLIEQSAAELRSASYSHDSNIGEASQWVINILRLVRPALTISLVVLAYSMPGSETFYLATTAVSWWFGDRARG